MGFQKVSNFIKGVYLASALTTAGLGYGVYNYYLAQNRLNILSTKTTTEYNANGLHKRQQLLINDEIVTLAKCSEDITFLRDELETRMFVSWISGNLIHQVCYIDYNNDLTLDEAWYRETSVNAPFPEVTFKSSNISADAKKEYEEVVATCLKLEKTQ